MGRVHDAAYICGEGANAFRDIDRPSDAQPHPRRSIAHARNQNRAPHGVLSHTALAATHIQYRDLEAAYVAAVRTVDPLQSSRSVDAVRDVHRQMKSFGAHPTTSAASSRSK